MAAASRRVRAHGRSWAECRDAALRSVLTIEDDAALAEVSHLRLAAAEEALGQARPSVVLADYQIGLETSEGLLARLVECTGAYCPRLVLLSAYPQAEQVAERLRLAHLPRPFALDDLVRVVTGGSG